ncbi:collagen-flanked surface repeat-containing protein, partial [Hutsoniella sourekii]|uniref:collagen-flanked surface repeat-containing protein n=1 Tax=Hutsoniella sourekii TaxID=87650 RepID=UPI000684EDAB
MLGKNNHQARIEKSGDKVYRYAIKRLTIGVASVAVVAGIQFSGLSTIAMASESMDTATSDPVALPNLETSVPTEGAPANAPSQSSESKVESEVKPDNDELEAPHSITNESSLDSSVTTLDNQTENTHPTPQESNLDQPDESSRPSEVESTNSQIVEEKRPTSLPQVSPTQRDQVRPQVNQPTVTSYQASPAEATGQEDSFDQFTHRVLQATQPKDVIREELVKVYDAHDVEGILNFISLTDVHSPEHLREEIVKAGALYADKNRSFAHVFASLPANQNVNNLINVYKAKLSANRMDPNSSGSARLSGEFVVKGDVEAGDYFTFTVPNELSLNGGVDYSRNNYLSGDRNLTGINGEIVATGVYDTQTKVLTYTFTDYVNNKKNIVGAFDLAVFTDRENTPNSKTFDASFNLAGEIYTEPFTIDYRSPAVSNPYGVGVSAMLTNIDNTGANNYQQIIYVNPKSNQLTNTYVSLYPSQFDGQKSSGNISATASNIRVYQVPYGTRLNDSYHVDTSTLTRVNVKPQYGVTSGVPYATLYFGNINRPYVVILDSKFEGKIGSDTIAPLKHRVRISANNSTYDWNSNFVLRKSSGSAVGVEKPGAFIATHQYQTIDDKGTLVSVDEEVVETPQTGNSTERYITQKVDREGYEFIRVVNPINDPNYSTDGSPTFGAFKPGVTKEVTYVYQRVEKQDLYEMTVEDSSFKTQFLYNDQLQPGEITKIQEGMDERVRVLYKHIDPATTPNFTPSNFVQMRGQYWQEVSREVVQEARDEIFEYNIETITETKTNPDGSVTIIYNSGREVHIPAPKPAEPAQPLLPKEPIVETERVTDTHPETGEQVRGTRVTIRVYNPNTDQFDKEEIRFIPDGKAGTDGNDGGQGEKGEDGKSSRVVVESGTNDAGDQGQWIKTYFDKNGDGQFTEDEVVSREFVRDGKDGQDGTDGRDGLTPEATVTDNGDGTHTVTIRTPHRDPQTGEVSYTETKTVIKDGEDGQSPKAEVKDNGDGTHTVTVTNPDGTSTETTIRDGQDGSDGQDGKDGLTPEVTVTDNGDGTHTVTIRTPYRDPQTGEVTYTETKTVIKDGEDGQSPKAEVKDNGDGTHTVTVTNPDGTTLETTIRDGKDGADGQDGQDGQDGSTPEAIVTDNPDGTHTLTIRTPHRDPQTGEVTYTETKTVIKDGEDGQSPKAEVKDNGDGTHTVTVTNPDGTITETTIRDGRDGADGQDGLTPEAIVTDNGDGTHTLTIRTPHRDPQTGEVSYTETKTVIKDGEDGQSSKAKVKDNGDGTHTVTVTNSDGTTTETMIRDGKDGADGQDGQDGQDGLTPEATVTDNGDGTHTVTIRTPHRDPQTGEVTYTETKTVIKDGEDGQSPKAEVKDNGDGTHTVTVTNPDGTTTETTIRDGQDGQDGTDGQDGLTPEAAVTDNGDGTHTVTIRTPQRDPQTGEVVYNETRTVIKDGEDGQSPKAEVKDNGDGTHTVTVTNPDGTTTETTIRDGQDGQDGKDGQDGLTPEATVTDNGDGTHTVTVRTPQRDPQTGEVTYTETKTVIKDGEDGQSPKAEVRDNGDGTHTVTVTNPDGTTTETMISDGQDGQDGADGKDGLTPEATVTDNG